MKAVYSHHNLPKPDGVKTPSFLAGLGYQVASPDATEPSEVRLSFIDFQSSRKPHFTINLTTPGEIHDEIRGTSNFVAPKHRSKVSEILDEVRDSVCQILEEARARKAAERLALKEAKKKKRQLAIKVRDFTLPNPARTHEDLYTVGPA
jgi:hypothetical protein